MFCTCVVQPFLQASSSVLIPLTSMAAIKAGSHMEKCTLKRNKWE
uniref:Uncharacterized protein n=1 Tax=Anguilla anguilla TaxID=7936 RepID=A0A0E9WLQ1_ANGAN